MSLVQSTLPLDGPVSPTVFTPRPYQVEAIDAGVGHLLSGSTKHGMLVLPTGSGKSVVIANVTSGVQGKTVVLQPSIEILEQNYKKYCSYGFRAGIYSASAGVKHMDKVTFATIGSIIHKKHLFKDFTNIIIDECHLVNPAEGMYRDFIKATSEASVLGLTATPYRLSSTAGGSMLKFLTRTRPVVFSKVLYYVQTAELFDAGYLAPLEYYSFDVVDRSMLKLNSTGSDFTDASVRAAYRQINMPAHTAHWANRLLAKRNNLLVFCALIDEAKETAKLVPGSVVLTGETDKGVRKQILRDFQSNKIRCVINVGVLTTGFDKPDLDTMLMARSTMSLGWYYQVIGRVMRPYTYPDGSVKTGYVVDLAGNIPMFGKIEKLRITYDSKGQICIHNGRRQLTNVTFTKN